MLQTILFCLLMFYAIHIEVHASGGKKNIRSKISQRQLSTVKDNFPQFQQFNITISIALSGKYVLAHTLLLFPCILDLMDNKIAYLTYNGSNSWIWEYKAQLSRAEPINSCVHLTKWPPVQLELSIYCSVTSVMEV